MAPVSASGEDIVEIDVTCPDLFDRLARNIIKDRDQLARGLPVAPGLPVEAINAGNVINIPFANKAFSGANIGADAKIGIIGAGPAGMYAALIFDSLGINYEILESEDRTGGRLWTYHFPQKTGDPVGTHDYFDLGAMRYPETPIMKRTFDLFKYPPLNTGDIQVEKHRIPYYMDTKEGNGIMLYNGKRYRLNEMAQARMNSNNDPFNNASIGVPVPYIKAGFQALFKDVVGRFAIGLERDLKENTGIGWSVMMKYDSYSTRSYMSHVYIPSDDFLRLHPDVPIDHLPTNVVNWMETMDKTTGWYDRALTTTVLEEMAFGFTMQDPKPEIKFSCLDGGSQVLTDAMQKYIEKRGAETNQKTLALNSRVAKVYLADPSSDNSKMKVEVHTMDPKTKQVKEVSVKEYDHVISTVPLTCLRHTIDISGCELSPMQYSALRQLQYTPAVKVGMKFRSAWWTGGKGRDGKPVTDRSGKVLNIIGGRSFTDRPVRIVVYPSYGLWDANDPTKLRDGPAVLIACFVWTDDAARIGGLIGSGMKDVEEQLRDLVLEDLSVVHDVALEELKYQFLDMHCVDWADQPNTMGAFALFGPGKFADLFCSLTVPAARGKFHFAGEAVSTRHGWVVGALDSAWRCAQAILLLAEKSKLDDFYKKWGASDGWVKDIHEAGGTESEEGTGTVKLENNLLLSHMLAFYPELQQIWDDIDALEKAVEGAEEAIKKDNEAKEGVGKMDVDPAPPVRAATAKDLKAYERQEAPSGY